MEDKEFFKQLKKETKNYSDSIEEGFCNFCLKIYFPELNDDEIENSIFGLDHHDDSIDSFIINDEQKEIHISQFKSSHSLESMSPLKKEWISYLVTVPDKLDNFDYIQNHPNPRIKDIATDYSVKKSKYEIKFHFFHLGYNPNDELIDIYDNLKYYDFQEIKEQYLEYLSKSSQTEPEKINISLSYDSKPEKIEKKIGRHHTFISIITGDEVVNLRKQFKYKLFDKNLRFSLGNNKINKAIVKSALRDKQNFYFFNNGITITSYSFKFRENNNSIRIDYPQIINGAQTVNAIYSAYRERLSELKRETGNEEDSINKVTEEFKELKLMFRIIQNDREKEEKFEHNVIECNNTQNAIKKRDFYANAPEQIELQKYFSKYGYFYEIKRGDRDYISKKNKHNILGKTLNEFKHKNEKRDIETLSSLWMAYYVQEPTSKEVGSERIFGETKYYDLVFPTSISEITDDLVKEMILAYNFYDIVEKETKIFRGVNSILALLSDIDSPGRFEKAKEIVNKSIIFNDTLKRKFENIDTFKTNRDTYTTKIRKYAPFSNGKYVVMATLKLIIDECGYLDKLINQTNLFENKNFLKNNIVKSWLPIILDELLIPEYQSYLREIGGSINAFYHRSKTFDTMKANFKSLDIEKDKDFEEIFELKI
ncbi:MAG: AIPR family protein [Bacteroidales bacterium]